MKVEIDIDQATQLLSDAVANPWLCVAAAALLWYPLAGLKIRSMDRRKVFHAEGDPGLALFLWAASPLWVPLMYLVKLASIVLWPLSGGVIQPYWRW